MLTHATHDATDATRDAGDAPWKLSHLYLVFLITSVLSSLATGQSDEVPPNFETRAGLACFDQSRKYLNLTCPEPASMVRVEEVTYAYSPDGNCLPTPEHCTYVVPELERYPCIGQSSCVINVPTGGVGPELAACDGKRGTYMVVKYDCIPAPNVIDVCSTTSLTAQWGFFASPRYPLNYRNYADCSLRLQTPHPSQRLHISIVDLSLENQGAKCVDWLQLFDGHRSETYCNVRSNHRAMTTFDNWVEVNFQSDSKNSWKGFWLYFEAFPYIDTPVPTPTPVTDASTTSSTPAITSTKSAPHLKSGSENATSKTPTSAKQGRQQQARDSLTVGIIVGVVLGILLCITVVLAVVLFLRK